MQLIDHPYRIMCLPCTYVDNDGLLVGVSSHCAPPTCDTTSRPSRTTSRPQMGPLGPLGSLLQTLHIHLQGFKLFGEPRISCISLVAQRVHPDNCTGDARNYELQCIHRLSALRLSINVTTNELQRSSYKHYKQSK